MYSVYIHSNYSRLNSLNKHDFLSYGISSFLLHTFHCIPIKHHRIYELWNFLIDGVLHWTIYSNIHKDTIVAPSSKSAVQETKHTRYMSYKIDGAKFCQKVNIHLYCHQWYQVVFSLTYLGFDFNVLVLWMISIFSLGI